MTFISYFFITEQYDLICETDIVMLCTNESEPEAVHARHSTSQMTVNKNREKQTYLGYFYMLYLMKF